MVLDRNVEIERIAAVLKAKSDERRPAIVTHEANDEVAAGIEHAFNRHAGVGFDWTLGEQLAGGLVLEFQQQSLTRCHQSHSAGPVGCIKLPVSRPVATVGGARGYAIDKYLVFHQNDTLVLGHES